MRGVFVVGSFLVAAFQYLIDHCVKAITANSALAKGEAPAKPRGKKRKRNDIAFKDQKGVWKGRFFWFFFLNGERKEKSISFDKQLFSSLVKV